MYGGAVGVRFDVRKLNVGDFLWIAKEKTPPLPGQCVCVHACVCVCVCLTN